MEGPGGVYLLLKLLPPEILVQDKAHYLPRITFIQINLVQTNT